MTVTPHVPDVSPSSAALDRVRETVVFADRRRRARHSQRQIWRLSPALAGIAVAFGALARWLAWPSGIALGLLVVGAAVLAAYAWYTTRARVPNDAVVAQLDADAGLDGELRSASWFAASDRRDPWTLFHLERAAERVLRVDWTTLYPAVRATRSWIGTTVLVIVVVALSVRMPGRATPLDRGGPGGTMTAAGVTRDVPVIDVLPPELQKRLADLLAKIEANAASPEKLGPLTPEAQALLDKLGEMRIEDLVKKLAEAADAPERRAEAAKVAQSLADRAKRAANTPNLPGDLKQTMKDLASTLEEKAAEQVAGDANGSTLTPPQAQSGQKGAPDAQSTAASIEFSRDGDANSGSGLSMLADAGNPNGSAGPGAGASHTGLNPTGPEHMIDVTQALRRETVEAAKDTNGDNVPVELRRKSEESQATVAFTHGKSATFDRSHAEAPPAIPEVRRAQVEAYFIRHP
jgi:hypothetical protein